MWSWLFGGKKCEEQPVQVAELSGGDGSFACPVVGESHYQDALDAVAGGKTHDGHNLEVTAYLLLDDHNPYDSNAVQVQIDQRCVGHLDRKTARSFRKQLRRAVGPDIWAAKVPAKIVGGWDRGSGDQGHYGVKLDLPVAE